MTTAPLLGRLRLAQAVYANVAVDASPDLVFDWQDFSKYTALAFVVVNKGDNPVVVTPEMSPDAEHVVTVGTGVPEAVTVPAGGCSYDPYGVDILARFWRVWLSSVAGTSVDVYVYGILRT